jgi:hypothetical protein
MVANTAAIATNIIATIYVRFIMVSFDLRERASGLQVPISINNVVGLYRPLQLACIPHELTNLYKPVAAAAGMNMMAERTYLNGPRPVLEFMTAMPVQHILRHAGG